MNFLKQYNLVLILTLKPLVPQNGQRHLNNSLANCLSVFDHFVKLSKESSRRNCPGDYYSEKSYSPIRSLRHTFHAGLQPLWNEGKQMAFIFWFSLRNTYNSENAHSSSNNAKSQPNLNFYILTSGKQWRRCWLQAFGWAQQCLKFLHS